MSEELEALVKAFESDPILAWWQGDGADSLRLRMFEELLRQTEGSGNLIKVGSPEGAFALCTWGNKRPGLVPTLRRAVASFVGYRAFAPTAKLFRLAYVSYALAKMLPTGNFLHIQYLMVNEAARGRGLGARLLAELVAEAKSRNVPCYGDVSMKEIDYFQRRGGKIVSQCELPRKGPRLTGLRFD